MGFVLNFKRNYNPGLSEDTQDSVLIGEVQDHHVIDAPFEAPAIETTAKDDLEKVAAQVQPPRASQNFMAPVDGVQNRRCQKWTIDFVRRLVQLGYISPEAIDVVQIQRDPPSFGVGLRPIDVGVNRSHAQ
ncbi:MAG: hypothetical protein M4579_000101 [Chaenotheca gracillima]|nr:MAG: hypothetical protein M4579_000101 [Chaenotheca gracillima]